MILEFTSEANVVPHTDGSIARCLCDYLDMQIDSIAMQKRWHLTGALYIVLVTNSLVVSQPVASYVATPARKWTQQIGIILLLHVA
jgi:hypothetical protein